MPDIVVGKHKHMTQDNRLEIHECLNRGMTFKAIARRIGKDQTTVSKEVKKHITVTERSVRAVDIHGNPLVPTPCPQLLKPPFVCNPCRRRRACREFDKHMYDGKSAQKNYEALRTESRTGIPLTREEFYRNDRIISDGIKRGQHLYHILQTNPMTVSKSTVYRHLQKGYLSVAAIDFPRVVKFRPRKQHGALYVPKALKVGRTYADFLAYSEENSITAWVEMDTLIGRVGGKAIVTLHFTLCNFMVGILVDNKTAAEVTKKLTHLKATLVEGGLQFGNLFPLVLTDNGGEFANVSAIETSLSGESETNLFFCDPNMPSQKPKVEKNHTLFRDIVPKGESFDHFTQDTVNLIFSHVNCVKRMYLNGKSPLELFSFTFGQSVAALLGITPVAANEVIQSPKLLQKPLP